MVYRPESLLRRVETLREYARDLDDLPIAGFADYEGNKTIRYAVERLLVLVAEVVIDILDHLLSARHSVISDGYEEVRANARANALISEELYGRLKGLGGLRNALTHRYLTISDKQTYHHFVKMRVLLPEVMSTLDALVREHP